MVKKFDDKNAKKTLFNQQMKFSGYNSQSVLWRPFTKICGTILDDSPNCLLEMRAIPTLE